MISDNNQKPIRASALAATPLSASAPSGPRRRGRWLALITTLSISALAIAVASPTPAFAAGETSPPSKSSAVKLAPTERVAPQVFEGDVRDLPKAECWKPGDPVREVNPLYGRPPPKKEGIQLEPAQPKLDPLLKRQESVLKGEETRALSPHQRKGRIYGCQ